MKLRTHTHKSLWNFYENDASFVQDRTALLFLLFPAMLLVLRSWVWDGCLPAFPVQIYQVFAFKPPCLMSYWDLIAYMMKHLYAICHLVLSFVRPGCYSFTLVWRYERTFWESTEVIFVHGTDVNLFVTLRFWDWIFFFNFFNFS